MVNLSLGTTDGAIRDRLHKACRAAADSGTVLIAAAHNDDVASYPAMFPEVIGVTGGDVQSGFTYQQGRKVECTGPGGRQRLCWLDCKEVFVGGTSFAAPHVAGAVALAMNKEWPSSLNDVRSWLEQSGSSECAVPVDVAAPATASMDLSWMGRVSLFPYNKEMHALVRYRHQLEFEIVSVGDHPGKGLVGKDAAEVLGLPRADLPIQPRFQDLVTGVDTVILGYVDQLARIHRRDLVGEYVEAALIGGSNVFSFLPVRPDAYPDLHELACEKGLQIAYPDIAAQELMLRSNRPRTWIRWECP